MLAGAVTRPGLFYKSLYYTHSPELIQIAGQHAWLLNDLARAIVLWTPALQVLVDGNGSSFTITREMIEGAIQILEQFHWYGGPELRAAIERELEILNLPSFIGLTMDEALAKVNERPLTSTYLPIVTR